MKKALTAGIVLVVAGITACSGGNNAIQEAVTACGADGKPGIRVGDGGQSISVDGKGSEDASGAEIDEIACILTELEVSDAVISRMDSTRALDGRQEGEWGDFSASWGYHPDSGMDLVIEVKQN